MTKKIMMVAVLLGALTLGACVDNKESASVEAVRNAKAAQLNSLAAMNNAEAEAKKIISEAEAALRNADAAFRKAQAEAESIETEKAKARLEGELAVIKIEAEADIADAKKELEIAKANLIKALDNVSIATKERINVLLGKADMLLNGGSIYDPATGTSTTVTGINDLREDLVDAKNELIKLKYDLVDGETLKEKEIIAEKLKKAKAEALIAEYEKYSKDDLADAEKVAAEANAKEQGLLKIKTAKTKVAAEASTALTTATSNMQSTLYYTSLTSRPTYFTTEEVAKYELVTFTHDNGVGDNVTKNPISKRVAKLGMFQDDINAATRNLAIARATESEAQKALNDVKNSQSYKDQVKAVADAQTAFNAATTAADKASAKSTWDSAESTLKSMTSTEESDLETATTYVGTAKTTLENANKALADVSGDNLKAYEDAIAKVLELRDSNAEASIASQKATTNHSTQSALATSLDNIVAGLANYADLILAQKRLIVAADKEIADMNNGTSSVITKEQAIAKKESKIAKLEVDLKANEASYSDYMTQIQDLISAE